MTASKGLRPALLFLSSGRPDYRLDLGAEALKRNDCIECLEWITLRADRFETLVEIEKARLSHSFPRAVDAGTRESDLHAARQCYFSRCPTRLASWPAMISTPAV